MMASLMDMEEQIYAFVISFSTVFTTNMHAEHLVRFFFTHPLVDNGFPLQTISSSKITLLCNPGQYMTVRTKLFKIC